MDDRVMRLEDSAIPLNSVGILLTADHSCSALPHVGRPVRSLGAWPENHPEEIASIAETYWRRYLGVTEGVCRAKTRL